jgi:hypothetical protein
LRLRNLRKAKGVERAVGREKGCEVVIKSVLTKNVLNASEA